jgi:hypothetical protein
MIPEGRYGFSEKGFAPAKAGDMLGKTVRPDDEKKSHHELGVPAA